jgi:hypothetical protein
MSAPGVATSPEVAHSAPLDYFERLSGAFEAAAERAGGAIEHRLAMGPLRVAMCFAGPTLDAVVSPAFQHLAAPAQHVDATVFVWDSESTGVPVPSFAWRPRHVSPRGDVEGYNDERFRTIYHGDVLAEDGGFNALSMYDDLTRTAVFWAESAERIHWWERSEPLRPILHWTLTGPGRYLAHAAAVADERGAVLLAGRGGSGKTTTTLACLDDGMSFVGDNYVLLSAGGETLVHSLYGTAKLRPGTLELLPRLAPAIRTRHVAAGEKLVVDMVRHRPSQMVSGVPVRAVVVPQVVAPGETRLVRASGAEAVLALAPTTVAQLPGNGGVLGPMAALARSLPTYRLELGGDVAAGPAAIRRVLEEVTGS